MRRRSASGKSALRRSTSFSAFVEHAIDQIVGLDAQALAARHLDERSLRIFRFRRRREAQLPRCRVRQRHHLVREVRQALGFGRMADRNERLLEQLLQIRLAHVDDVVGRRGRAERRMFGPASVGSLVVAHSVAPSMRVANWR